MSRYGGDPRYSDGNLAYRDSPPPQRWDADRFARERDYRQAPPPPEDYYYVPSPRRPARAAPVYEEERYYEDDRYARGGVRQERMYYEEDDYYNDPRARQGQMIPFRPQAPARPQAPPRPGALLRRQSSLDTFDRPPRRFDDYDAPPPPRRAPPRVGIPVPEPPAARGNRYRPAQPGYSGDYSRRDSRAYYDDIAVQDPDYYGDDGFREYREREWISHRRRSSSRSRSRSRDRKTEIIDDKKSETIDIRPGEIKVHKKEEKIEEEKRSEPAEKPFPRRGKTKMPKRRVHTKVLFDLGYSYYEENDKTIIIEKALGPDNIDEIFVKSKQYWEQEAGTTRLLEAPPAGSATTVIVPSIRSPSPQREEVREEVREIEITTKPLSEAPRSVREWDSLRVEEPTPSRRSRSVRSRRTRRSPSPEARETIFERRTEVLERSPSPARTHGTARSRRRGSVDRTEVVERKIITEEDGVDFDESNSIHVGPLALVVDRHKSRSDRELREEIARLQRERRKSRHEVDIGSDEEIVRIERHRPRPPSPVGEVIIERRGEEVIEVRKDKRGRMSLVR